MKTDIPSEDNDFYCSLGKSFLSHSEINRSVGFTLSTFNKVRRQSDVDNCRSVTIKVTMIGNVYLTYANMLMHESAELMVYLPQQSQSLGKSRTVPAQAIPINL